MKKSSLFVFLLFVMADCFTQNVGIGISTPAFKVDINGSFNTNHDYRIDGSTIVGIHGPTNLRIGQFTGLALAGGTDNTFCGYQAGYSVNTGSDNSFFGSSAGYFNQSGGGNSFFGAFAGFLNTGRSNSFFGTSAGTNNNNGYSNSFFGRSAGYSNTSGRINTAVGDSALYNSNAIANTAIGYHALTRNTTGNGNTATGAYSMEYNTTGINNTAYGFSTMRNHTTSNDISGFGAHATLNGEHSNVTVLGANTTGTADNQVRIGNGLVNSIGGYVSWTVFSDGRFKKNISKNVPGLSFIQKLNPVTYNLDLHDVEIFLFGTDGRYPGIEGKQLEDLKTSIENGMIIKEKITYTGFIAQEVEASAHELGFNFSGVDAPQNDKDLYGLRYAEFVVPLVKAVQEQQTILENQKLEISGLKLNIAKLQQQETVIISQQKTIDELLVRMQKMEKQLLSKTQY